MKRRENFLSAFFVVVILCILLLTFSLSGNLKFLSSFLEKPIIAMQSLSYNFFQKLPFISEDPRIKRLEDENLELLSRVADFEKLKKENAALSDQFQTTYPPNSKLLEVQIIGAPGFIPGVSVPDTFILNKGSKDGLKTGQAVAVKNNLVGTIAKVSAHLAKLTTVNNSAFSFTAKTENGEVGVVRGGGNLTIDDVLLSANIKPSELVFTKGDINSDGIGIPPDLVVGKITSVEKNPSSLFQKAQIASFVNFANLSFAFVYMQNK